MAGTYFRLLAVATVFACGALHRADAHDLRLTLPKHSELTPVQKLNREGVEAIRKQQYDKARAFFLKAYLYDPADPFTLNNLGYVSELQGDLERALNFYKLAAQQGTDASIDRSNARQLEGRPMSEALNNLKDKPMQVNHMNVEAIQLLAENRNAEADTLLRRTLTLDPANSFTLNNLGVAEESLGDYDNALKNYGAAAQSHSTEPVVITLDKSWRGKPVSQMAAESVQKLEKRLKATDSDEARAALLSVRGVSETNRNDWQAARADFLKAYALDPHSAFSLNNLGYVSEHDGDMETAQFFYFKAQEAENARTRIGLASQASAEGQHLVAVAADSDTKVNTQIDQARLRREKEPAGDIELLRRDGTPVDTSPTPQSAAPTVPEAPKSSTNPPAASTTPQAPQSN